MSWLKRQQDKEEYNVRMQRGAFIDERRNNREVPYKIYYPSGYAGDKLPLIVWSHGLGGSCDGAGFLGRHMASCGYIVLHVTHFGTDTSLWEGKPGHPWDNIRAAHISRKVTLARFQDIPFVLDQILAGHEFGEDVENIIDTDRIGMSGHSFGAITTQVMAGQMLGKRARKYRLFEDRFKAAIAYCPSPTYNHSSEPHEDIYGSIELPTFYMTGTEDDSPVSNFDYTYRLPIYKCAQGDDQHLIVIEDADHMVFAGSRGKLGANPLRSVHEDIIKTSSQAFWDAYLKEDEDAFLWLTGEGYQSYLDGQGVYENRNMRGNITARAAE